MRTVIRSLLFVVGSLLLAAKLQAHQVVWWSNFDGSLAFMPVSCYGTMSFPVFIGVVPSTNEPCTVVVNLDPPASNLVAAQIVSANPANSVYIQILVLRPPNGSSETATISGEWHATGSPAGFGCTSVTPTKFTVPVVVQSSLAGWVLSLGTGGIQIDAGINCTLQTSESLTGQWINIGVGQVDPAFQ